jgi:hypothetical protein
MQGCGIPQMMSGGTYPFTPQLEWAEFMVHFLTSYRPAEPDCNISLPLFFI